MGVEGYRGFVQPEHPLVAELFPDHPRSPAREAARRLEEVLERARERIDYDPAPGRTGFDELLAAVAGRPKVRMNCIDVACVVVSHLRRLGFTSDQAWVAVAGRSNPLQASFGVDFHAWVLVLLDGDALWVDPATLTAERVTPLDLLATHRIYAFFNDRDVRFLEAQKRRLLEAAPARAALRLYLFGRAQPEIRAALDDRQFRELVSGLLRDGTVDGAEAASVDSDRLSLWNDAGFLVRNGSTWTAGPRLVAVRAGAEAELAAELGGLMDRYLGLIGAAVAGLRAEVLASEVGRTWGWPRLSYAVVLGMLVDLAIGRELDVERMAGGDGATVWAFERTSTRHAVGVVWAESPDARWAVGQLWHREVARQPVRLGPGMVAQLGRIALGERLPASAETLYLRHVGLLRRRGSGLEPALPVFLPCEVARLSPRLRAAARRAAVEVMEPALSRAARLPAWRTCATQAAPRAAVVRLILDYATQRVVDAGLVAPPAEAAADTAWGRWLWLGEVNDALPRSLAACAPPAEGLRCAG